MRIRHRQNPKHTFPMLKHGANDSSLLEYAEVHCRRPEVGSNVAQ